MVADIELLAMAVCNPGRLTLGPTTTTGGFPYGGLSLGFHRGMEFKISVEYQKNKDPSSGQINEVARRSVENVALGCFLEGVRWDENMLQAVFLKTVQGGNLPFQSPSETQVLGSSSPRTVRALPPILFVPEDSGGECVYFLRPLVLLDLRDGIKFSHERKSAMPLLFLASAALNRDPFQTSRLENITL